MDNQPQFKIHGNDRRKLKKELSLIKSIIKDFWHDHQMDADMASFYGGSERLMSDEDAMIMFDKNNKIIKELEEQLAVPYSNEA